VRRFLEDDLDIHLDWVEIPETFRLILTDPGEQLHVTIPYGRGVYVDAIAKAVSGSGPTVSRYVDLFTEVVEAITHLGESRGNPDRKVLTSKYCSFLRTAPYTVDQVARAMHVPAEAKKILDALWIYLGPSTTRLNFTVFAAMMAKLIEFSGLLPHHRSHEFTSPLEARFRILGGETRFNARVDRILVEEGGVAGVVTAAGEKISTRHAAANAAPGLVYNRLIAPKEAVSEQALEEANARRFGVSAVTVYLGLDAPPENLGLDAYSYLISANMDTGALYRSFETIDAPKTQASACLNAALPECSPPGTTILAITTLYRPDAWAGVQASDYVATKNRIAAQLVAHFERASGAPIRGHIEEVEVATPVTFARYTGVHGGTIYGYEPESWDSLIPRMMAMNDEKHIEGLEFGGGYTFRCHGNSSSFTSGQVAGLLTLQSLMKDRA
jgi:phytoene dehydrogenase-like protein